MLNLEQLRAILRVHKEELSSRFKVEELGIFGSRARGDYRELSDVDILVEFSPEGVTFDNYMELKFYLEELLRVKVDLVMKSALKSSLRQFILKEVVYV